MTGGIGRAAVARILRRWRVRIWVALGLGLGLALGAVPLASILGFELAVIVAAFAAIAGLDLGAALAREIQKTPAEGIVRATFAGRTLAATTLCASALAIGVALMPGIVCAIRGIWVPTCDWTFGIVSYAALPVVTAALAGAVGHAVGVVVGPRRFVGAALAQLPLVLLVAHGLWVFYTTPPVFTYSPIVGYFPGELYDERVDLGSPLLYARLEQLAWVIAIVAIVATRLDVAAFRARLRAPRPSGRRTGAIAIALVAAACAVFLRFESGALGFAIDESDIAAELGGRRDTAHFVIYYANTPEIAKHIDRIARDHEFRYAQVVAQLGVAPAGKLTSYYFRDGDQKARWFGARNVEMTKPWRREIYIDHQPFPHPSLRHEIAHAIASEFGDPIFGVSTERVLGLPVPFLVRPGLVEGLAVAVDWPGISGPYTPDEAVHAMMVMGLSPSVGELLSMQFFAFSSARGYTTAGSFCRFLLDRYGAPRFRAVYENGGDFESAYGMPLHALEAEWRQRVAQVVLPREMIEGQRERFRGGSVFARPCPHAVAERIARANAARDRGDIRRAIAAMRDVCRDAPDEPSYRERLADTLAQSHEPHDRAEAIDIWTSLAASERITSTARATALERLAGVAGSRGDYELAQKLLARAAALPIDRDQRRTIDAQLFALAHAGPAGAALRGYFFLPHVGDRRAWAYLALVAEPELGFAHYLVGFQAAHLEPIDRTRAAAEFERALALELPGPAFVRQAARDLVVAAYLGDDPIRASRAIAALLGPDMMTTDRLYALDWIDRLRFDGGARL